MWKNTNWKKNIAKRRRRNLPEYKWQNLGLHSKHYRKHDKLMSWQDDVGYLLCSCEQHYPNHNEVPMLKVKHFRPTLKLHHCSVLFVDRILCYLPPSYFLQLTIQHRSIVLFLACLDRRASNLKDWQICGCHNVRIVPRERASKRKQKSKKKREG